MLNEAVLPVTVTAEVVISKLCTVTLSETRLTLMVPAVPLATVSEKVTVAVTETATFVAPPDGDRVVTVGGVTSTPPPAFTGEGRPAVKSAALFWVSCAVLAAKIR